MKPDIENIRNKLTAVQVTKLCKIGMICFAKSLLTEDLYIVQKEEFLITCYMYDTNT
jgi:hypothetical protein